MSVNKAVKARGDEILKRIIQIKHPKIAEVGVAMGRLSGYLLQRRKDLTLVMVDNWLSVDDQSHSYRQTRDTNAHVSIEKQQVRRASAYAVAGDRARIIEMDSKKAAEMVSPGSLDLVFIDADHSYQGCKADIEAWRSTVRQGGWLGGHDYANKDPRFAFAVQQAVDEVFPEVELGANYTWWVRL